MKNVIFAALLMSMSMPLSAVADNCKTLVDRAEKTSDSSPSAAEPVARAAIVACTKENQKTSRPYMVLSVIANSQQRFKDVIKWSEQALTQEPGLPLAYMNMCSAYMQMKQYDQAVTTCKKGLVTKNQWSAKLNFNIGLTLFQKAVGQSKFGETLSAEPYFKESQRLDPSIAQNDYYLGIIEENTKSNPKAAVPLYEAGCKKGSAPACEAIPRAKAAVNAVAVTQPAAQPVSKTEPASQEEENLWSLFESSYRKKGLDAVSAKRNVGAVRKGMSKMQPALRVQTLQSMLKQMQ